MKPELFDSVNKAFSKQSDIFNEIYSRNPITTWMRKQIRPSVLKDLKPGMSMLELNAGTGLDAVFFAQKGIHVHATDLSFGMINELKNTVKKLELEKYISIQQCSFTDLLTSNKKDFDYIYSNFGGLNCIDDLTSVTKQFQHLLKPGGIVTIVIMPKICPWEILSACKGNFKMAFRRFKKNGAVSNIEGVEFLTFYFSVSEIKKAFGKDFKLISLKGLATLSPPPYKENWAIRNPKFYHLLSKLDEKFCKVFPFNQCADYVVATFKYVG